MLGIRRLNLPNVSSVWPPLQWQEFPGGPAAGPEVRQPPFFPLLVLLARFRYHPMRYKFTDEGNSMRRGI